MKLSPRAKRRLRRAGYVVGAVAVYCIAHLFLMAVYPNPLFPHTLSHRNFTVHMREPVPPEVTTVLDRVHALIAASPLHDESLHHHV